MRPHTILIAAALLAACEPVQPLAEYRPVTDPTARTASRYDADRADCITIATRVEADYRERQQREALQNAIAGAIFGAAIGAVAGSGTGAQGDWIAAGAAYGAVGSAGSGDYGYDLVTYGPRRIVDRCMASRGHVILGDLGRS